MSNFDQYAKEDKNKRSCFVDVCLKPLGKNELAVLKSLSKSREGILRLLMDSCEIKAANRLVRFGFAYKGSYPRGNSLSRGVVNYTISTDGINYLNNH